MSDVYRLNDLDISAKSLPEFTPPPRFGETKFESYKPQDPSQADALQKTQSFLNASPDVQGGRFPWQKKTVLGKGLYLDGGFGVGKTHLLASAYSAYEGSKVYMSFSELVHAIGVLGKEKAQLELGNNRLYCIDEFELDDPGNTLIVKTFLNYVFEQGGFVLTTSNTPPAAQGQGRFNASDFKREIQSIAERFETLKLEGPDYRKREKVAELLSTGDLEHLERTEPASTKVDAHWSELFTLLQSNHPIRYAHLLKQMDALYLRNAEPISNQNDAIRFVHFIDKLYDLKIGFRLSGDIALDDLFDDSYKNSAYAKKHYRCLSRISELLEER
ncbi:MAG: cell division protein ZapE [Trueperaceae bacterium]|nr:cell division protein ZapE [Trueperaceae bacterium]